MNINRAQLNVVIVHVLVPLPLLLGSSILAYIFLFWRIFRTGRIRNLALILGAIAAAWLLVNKSLAFDSLTPQMRLNAFNMAFSLVLIILSPLFRIHFPVAPSRYADTIIFLFLIVLATMLYVDVGNAAIVQLASFSVALYIFTGDTTFRRLLGASALILAGARMLMIAAAVALLLFRSYRLALICGASGLIAAIVFAPQAELWLFLQDILEGMRADGNLYKGRVNLWLTLLANDLTFFGHGAGSALLALEARVGEFHLPHNDYLRIYTDFGVVTILLVLSVFSYNATRQAMHQRLSTALLALFMVSGNPLSFPTVIVSYLLVMNATMGDRALPRTDARRGGGAGASENCWNLKRSFC